MAVVLICGVPSAAPSGQTIKVSITKHIERPGGVKRGVGALRGNAVTVRGGIYSVVDLPLASRTDLSAELQKPCGDICMAVTITL